jgi:hypothetical protein
VGEHPRHAGGGDAGGNFNRAFETQKDSGKMNRKQFVILVIVGVIAGLVGWNVSKRKRESFTTSDAGAAKLIPNFPINEIAQVRIKQSTGEVNLVKKDDLWRVKERADYPANFTELGDFLRKVQDLKTIEEVKVGPSQMGRLELNSPDKAGTNSATLVEFKDGKGANLKSLMLGKKYSRSAPDESAFSGGGFPVGRYVMVPGGDNKVWLINDAMTQVEAKPESWLNKDFFKVEKLKSISVTHQEVTNSWTLTRDKEGGDLKLADAKPGENLDTGKASGAGYALSSPSFNDVVVNPKPEETGLDKPTTAKLETFDGFTYTVKLGKPMKDDNYPLQMTVEANIPKEREAGKDEKPADKEKLDKEFKEKQSKLEEKLKKEKSYEKWTYLVAKWSVDPLLKERKDLLAEKKDENKDEKKDTSAKPATPADPLKDIVPQLEPK